MTKSEDYMFELSFYLKLIDDILPAPMKPVNSLVQWNEC